MTDLPTILEINDCAVRLTQAEQVLASPGFALFEDNWVATGDEAQTRYRLRPLNGNNNFWQQLNLDPLGNASGLIQHSGDLVYHHLSQLLADAGENGSDVRPLLIAYPGFYSDEQLSLLLGICQSLNRPVAGLVNSALLFAANQPPGNYLVIDQYLHHTLISQVAISAQQVSIEASQLLSNTGWVSLSDALARAISDEFIRHTRFNPRHDAEHEQTLYNQLPQWLEQVSAGDCSVQVADKSVTLGFNVLADAGRNVLQPIMDGVAEMQQRSAAQVLLCPSAAALPYWYQDLAKAQLEPQHLATQAQRFAARLIDTSEQEGVLLTEELALKDAASPQAEAAAASSATPPSAKASRTITAQPTHILTGAHAHAIAGENWLAAEEPALCATEPSACFGKLSRTAQGKVIFTPTASCLLNDQTITEPTELQAQDVLANDQVRYQLIQVIANG
ncbi:hypothetical protein [Halioxenophilus aromaticivorans]|uniref:Uncharacterized protein n=1 Tax=Halioxenophilus aromaticivorans TaxID=1306992 RepID=A0AAV3U5P7_9ALTE